MKIISFLGSEKADFVYYIAQIIKRMGVSVLVMDNSRDGALYAVYASGNERAMRERYLEEDNALYVKGMCYQREILEKFDYCICFSGLSDISNVTVNSNLIYAMPNYDVVVMNCVKKQLEKLGDVKENVRLLMRDLVTDKISDLAVLDELSLSPDKMMGALLLEPMDEAKYISMQYNGRQSVKGLSKEYIGCLSYVISEIADLKEKDAVKAVQKA